MTSEKCKQVSEVIQLDDNSYSLDLFGQHNKNLSVLERRLNIEVNARGNELHILGEADKVGLAIDVLQQLYDLVRKKFPVSAADFHQAISILQGDRQASVKEIFQEKVLLTASKKMIVPRSTAQRDYVDAIRKNDMVFSIGPAGTGKTYLAMAMAVKALNNRDVKRIMLTRPAVEAGERLGFLPGDLAEKINPYLRPLYDALYDMVGFDKANGMVEQGIVEVAPIAFMRGRTLNDAFVILDEAQNVTPAQMKMFLTRLGFGSKAVITGDITQIDLPDSQTSGLVQVRDLLEGIEGIAFSYFSKADVVRHPLVQKIIEAYDKEDDGR